MNTNRSKQRFNNVKMWCSLSNEYTGQCLRKDKKEYFLTCGSKAFLFFNLKRKRHLSSKINDKGTNCVSWKNSLHCEKETRIRV